MLESNAGLAEPRVGRGAADRVLFEVNVGWRRPGQRRRSALKMAAGESARLMPVSTAQLINKIDNAIASRSSHSDPIGGGRRMFLEHIRELVRTNGLPLPDDCKLDACAMPYIFQQLNYDGYDWSNRNEDFDDLSDIVDIDVIVWSGGRDRMELTDDEFADYHEFCHSAIKYRSR